MAIMYNKNRSNKDYNDLINQLQVDKKSKQKCYLKHWKSSRTILFNVLLIFFFIKKNYLRNNIIVKNNYIMTSYIDINELKEIKRQILERKKTIPKENIEEIKEILKEYFRIQKKIQYYSDDEHRINK